MERILLALHDLHDLGAGFSSLVAGVLYRAAMQPRTRSLSGQLLAEFSL
jgi:hypothetical protein